MNNPIYKIENLDYKNNNNLLLKIKKFEIHRGACYLFKGEMGAGKTLLLNLLNKTTYCTQSTDYQARPHNFFCGPLVVCWFCETYYKKS